MFRNRTFSVWRRFSDFLGLYEKLSVKHSLNGCIIPPPPEKSVVGMELHLSVHVCQPVSKTKPPVAGIVCKPGRFHRCRVLITAHKIQKDTSNTMFWLPRDDQSEGGKGGLFLGWLCGEEESSSGEVEPEAAPFTIIVLRLCMYSMVKYHVQIAFYISLLIFVIFLCFC